MADVTPSSPSFDSSTTQHRNLVLTVAKGAGIAMIARISSKVFLLGSQAFLARTLGQADYGLWALGWSVFQVGTMAAALGLPMGVIRFGAPTLRVNRARFRQVVQQILALVVLSGIFWGLALFLGSSWIAGFYHKPALAPVLRWIAIPLGIAAVLRVVASTVQITRVGLSIVLRDLLPAIFLGLGAWVLTFLFSWGIQGALWSLALAQGLALGVALVALFVLYRDVYRPAAWTWTFFREVLGYALPVCFSGLLFLVLEWTPRLVLGYFRPVNEVGIYQAAAQTATLPGIILFSISSIFSPVIARLAGQEGTREQINELYKITTKWSFYLSIPPMLALLLFPKTALGLLFGSSYMEGSTVLLILALAQLFHAATGTVTTMHAMLGRQKALVIQVSIGALTTFLLNVALVPSLGVVGAALGGALGLTTANLLGIIYLRRALRLWPYDKRYGKGLLAGGGTLLVMALFQWTPLPRLWQAGLASVVGVVVFLALLWWLHFDEEDQIFFDAVWRRVRRGGKAKTQA
ncbi:MAG: flippase [Chloroflexi bacterium]|nr:flippase [Chloroflexota bacterium]